MIELARSKLFQNLIFCYFSLKGVVGLRQPILGSLLRICSLARISSRHLRGLNIVDEDKPIVNVAI